MDYTSLKEITETIITVLQTAVDDTSNWPTGFEVSPELHKDENTGLGFYLFHVQESSHYRNFPAPGNDNPPVKYTPMALNLFYQLSANSTNDAGEEDAYDEQNLMSVAMKALHDHSIISITTSGKKVNIKITLQTLTPSESVQYWAAAQSPVRLSAYYEVSVVFLEPDNPLSYAGRVLSYGNFIFLKTALQITASQNTIEYVSPIDLTINQVKIQPAQAPASKVLIAGDPIPIASVVSFIGTGFNTGSLKVLIISPIWDRPEMPDANEWRIKMISENQLDILVQETIQPGGTINIIPGLYSVQFQITKQFILPNGTTKDIHHSSNQFPFSVMPRIDSVTARAGSAGVFDIAGYSFEDADIIDDDIQVYIGEIKLNNDIAGSPQYQVTDNRTMNINIPSTIRGQHLPLRIMVRGIESEPRWITIP